MPGVTRGARWGKRRAAGREEGPAAEKGSGGGEFGDGERQPLGAIFFERYLHAGI